MQSTRNGSTSDATKVLWPPKGHKIVQRQIQTGKHPSYFVDLCVQTKLGNDPRLARALA